QANERENAGEAERDEDEVRAAQPDREPTGQVAAPSGDRDRGDKTRGEGPGEAEREQRRRVGADSEERGVAEREQARVAEEEVQAQREDREDPGHDEDVQVIRARQPEGDGEQGQRQGGVQGPTRRPGHRRLYPTRPRRVKRPAGRKRSTRMMMTKPT